MSQKLTKEKNKKCKRRISGAKKLNNKSIKDNVTNLSNEISEEPEKDLCNYEAIPDVYDLKNESFNKFSQSNISKVEQIIADRATLSRWDWELDDPILETIRQEIYKRDRRKRYINQFINEGCNSPYIKMVENGITNPEKSNKVS